MADKSYKSTLFKRAIDLGKITVGIDTDLVKVWRTSTGEEKAISLGDIAGGLIGDYVPYTGAVDDVDLGEYGLSTGYIKFDTTPTNTPLLQGTLAWADNRSTLSLVMNGTLQYVGQSLYLYAKNSTGSLIAKGTNVGFAGTDGASGHVLISKFLANGSSPSIYYIGVTSEAIANGAFGQVMVFGELAGINTSLYPAGSLLYASTTVAGGFQTTVPQAPNNIILVCATINSKNNGDIIVRPTIGSNINNDEGVKITSGTTGDLLQLQASGLWENKTVASVIGTLASKWTSVGSDIYRNSRVLVGGTTFDHSNSIFEIQHSTDNYVKGLTIVNSRSWGWGSRITFRVPLTTGGVTPNDAAAIEQNYDSSNNYNLSFYTTTGGTLSLKAVLNSGGNLLLGTSTDGGQKLQVTGNVALRASASSSPATQIPVFVANPASTTRELVTRTPAQFVSDLGIGKKFEQWTKKSAVTSSTNLLVVDKGSSSFTTSDLAVGNVYKLRFTIYEFNGSGATNGDHRLKIGGQTYTIDMPLNGNEQAIVNIEFIMICASGADSARVLTFNPILGLRSSVIGDPAYGVGDINYFTPSSLTVNATSTLTMTYEGDVIGSVPEMVYASCEKIN